MSQPAKIIFLHGASSSGKSTLAKGLQQAVVEPFWHVSIDHLRDAGVLPMNRFREGDFRWNDERAKIFNGFHRSLAAYASAGNNLIVEHILDTDSWFRDLVDLLQPFDVFFVAVHCHLVELRKRELARGNRPAGSAEQDYRTIHRNLGYDLEIQSEDGVETNVERILSIWKARTPLSTFKLSFASR